MTLLRSVATVLSFAAVTTAASLTLFWPKTTFADGDLTTADLTLDGTNVGGDVVVKGEIVRDRNAKSGWAIQVEAENRGEQAATAELETDLTRLASSPMSRAAPMPTAVFRKKETVTIAAHEKVSRRYEIPAALATQVASAVRAETAREKALADGKMVSARPTTHFDVAFRSSWTGDQVRGEMQMRQAAEMKMQQAPEMPMQQAAVRRSPRAKAVVATKL